VRRIAGPALALGLLTGCNPAVTQNAPPATPTAARPDPNPTGPAPAPASEITLKTVKFAGLDEFVRQQRGKVVVIDVWADW
jgi:hypothetical protein